MIIRSLLVISLAGLFFVSAAQPDVPKCTLESHRNLIDRLFFSGSSVNLVRSGHLVASGSMGKRRTNFSRAILKNTFQLHNSDPDIIFDSRPGIIEKTGNIFFNVTVPPASGYIITGEFPIAPILQIYYLNSQGENISVHLEYLRSDDSGAVLDDVACLLRGVLK